MSGPEWFTLSGRARELALLSAIGPCKVCEAFYGERHEDEWSEAGLEKSCPGRAAQRRAYEEQIQRALKGRRAR